jgi:hypothetical protein
MGAAGQTTNQGDFPMTDTDNNLPNLDLHELLAQRREIAFVWSIEDVQNVREDLNDNQAWEVLLQCQRVHDCNDGFTWLLIEAVADSLFPTPE